MKHILVIAILISMSGCRMLGIGGSKKDKYPGEIAGLCEQARGEAKQLCINAGLNVSNDPRLIVRSEPGDFKQSGVWVKRIPGRSGDIGGLGDSGYVLIYHNPANPADVDYGILVHEMCHHYLDSNGYGLSHVPQLRGKVKWWR